VFLAGALLAWTWTCNEDLGFQLNAARFFWEHGEVPRGGLLSMGLQTLLSSSLISFLGFSFRMKKEKRKKDN